MERLLNVKEAAEFLNVSEMTVRRWTNAGWLRCYRVGARRARRFRPQDLTACLEGDPAPAAPGMIPVGIDEITVPDGAHITHLSTAENEALEIAGAYILKGLEAGETVCVVAPEDKIQSILTTLHRGHTPLERFYAAGKVHLSRGMDTPERQKEYLVEFAARSGGRFRVFGDMNWTQKKGWPAGALRRFEEIVNQFPYPRNGLFLCQYPLKSFTGKEVMVALETHTHNIYRGQIKENFFVR